MLNNFDTAACIGGKTVNVQVSAPYISIRAGNVMFDNCSTMSAYFNDSIVIQQLPCSVTKLHLYDAKKRQIAVATLCNVFMKFTITFMFDHGFLSVFMKQGSIESKNNIKIKYL